MQRRLCAMTAIGCFSLTMSYGALAESGSPMSDHFDGKRFFNPEFPEPHGFGDLLKFLLGSDYAEWPKHVSNPPPALKLSESLAAHQAAVTFVNHATMLIQLPDLNILTDPIWSKRASPVSWAGPARARDPGIPFDQLPRIDLVLISHNHYDHLDLTTLKMLAARDAPRFLVASGDKALLEGEGIQRVHEFDWWQSIEIDPKTVVTFTPTQHFSSRTPWDRNESLWGSYMIQRDGKRIYFGGDAGYSSHYKAIREKVGSPDLAFLPIGAYEPRWFMKPMHMNPAEAVRAHQDLDAKRSIGIHFGCFQLTTEAIDQPVVDLGAALRAAQIPEETFLTLGEGQTRVFDL